MPEGDITPSCLTARSGRFAVAGLAVLLAGALFIRLGDDVKLNGHEALLAATARNMVENRPVEMADGSRPSPWLVPNFNGHLRLVKPPLPYWLAASLGRLTGRLDDFSARLPSALAALGTILILIALLKRQGLGGAALWAAAVLATTAGFLTLARRALGEMPLTFFVTATLACAWMGTESSGGRRVLWLALCGASAGLAALCKGPVVLQVLPLPLLVLAVWPRAKAADSAAQQAAKPGGWRSTLVGLILALAVFVAIALPWPLYIYERVPDALSIWKSQSVDRAAGEFGHEEPRYYYLLRLPYLVAPWTFFVLYGMGLVLWPDWRPPAGPFSAWGWTRPLLKAVPAALRDAWREPQGRTPFVLYGAWFIGSVIALSAAAGKQNHYALPLMPSVAAFAGLAMQRLTSTATAKDARRARLVLMIHAIVLAALGLAGVVYCIATREPFLWAVVGLAAVLVGAAILSIRLGARGKLAQGLSALFGGVLVAFLIGWVAIAGQVDAGTLKARFAEGILRATPPDSPLYSFADEDSQVIYYAGRNIPMLPKVEQVQEVAALGRPFYLACVQEHGSPEGAVAGLELVLREPNPRKQSKSLALFKWSPPAQ